MAKGITTEIKSLLSIQGLKVSAAVAAGIAVYYGFLKPYVDQLFSKQASA